MRCPECGGDNPEVASFCHRCGRGLRERARGPHGRADAWAVQSAESVTQFALISTIMPHTNRRAANRYRWALVASGTAILVLTLLGLLPAAILAAAFLVPATYLLYVYDVNLWEDQPVPVVLGVFAFTGALSTLVSLLFYRWAFAEEFLGFAAEGRGDLGVPWGSLLLFAVLLPAVAAIAMNVGPVILASRPAFDDMIDGLTFGIASGTAYAAFETIVQHWGVFASGELRTVEGLGTWVPIVLNLMVVKSLIYGTATGIAVAAFSGRGEGYDGFTRRYAANLGLAIAATVAFWLGVQMLARLPLGETLGLVWGLVILAALVVRIRMMLHAALLEAAVEAAASDTRPKGAVVEGGACPECEMPLLDGALFCIVCGESVRATSAAGRRHVRQPAGEGTR